MDKAMIPEDFILQYEKALASQDWYEVEPLIAEEAIVVFSDGSEHSGINAIARAFKRNFKAIKNESYHISNVQWKKKGENYAVYDFEFEWSGIVNGNKTGGKGTGTSVIVKEAEQWFLLSEELRK